ncbi:MAG: PAS domain S-box protein, partial [Bacteroidia bacterium]|nr:PAS domain S-box protein [Bacteroidia bacterium]
MFRTRLTLLKEMASHYLRLGEENAFTLLSAYPSDELPTMVNQCLEVFLSQVTTNQTHEIKANTFTMLPDPPVSATIRPEDLLLSYSLQRQLFLDFLAPYTSDVALVIELVREMESFYRVLEQRAEPATHAPPLAPPHPLSQKEYYLTLLDNFPSLIWRSDTNTACNYFNNAWLEFTGRSFEQELGNGWLEGIHPDDRSRCLDTYLKAFAAHQPFEIEYRLRRHDSVYRWIVNFGKPISDSDGEFSGYLSACFDIQEHKDAEQEIRIKNDELGVALEELKSTEEQLIETNTELLRTLAQLRKTQKELTRANEALEQRVAYRTALLEEQRAALHNLFMQVPALIGILRGREGRVELFNPTFQKLWGNRPVMGKIMREAWPEMETQGYFEFVESVYDTGIPVIRYEYPGYIDRHNQGEVELAYFDFIYAPYLDLEGKVDGVIIYGIEVTAHVQSRQALKNINEELKVKNEELIRINTDLDSFIYAASHDLKSPIVNIEGATNGPYPYPGREI